MTPETAAHQAPPSLGFSRQEHWSGLPFPSPVHESEKWKWSLSVVSNSSRPHGLQPTRLLYPWDFPGKSTGVGRHCILLELTVLLLKNNRKKSYCKRNKRAPVQWKLSEYLGCGRQCGQRWCCIEEMLQKKVWLIPERGPPRNCRANCPVFTHCKCWSRSQTSRSVLTSSIKNSRPDHTRRISAGSTVKMITPEENWEERGMQWNCMDAMQLLKAWHKPLCINVKGFSWWMQGEKARHWTVYTEWWHLYKTRLFKNMHTSTMVIPSDGSRWGLHSLLYSQIHYRF